MKTPKRNFPKRAWKKPKRPMSEREKFLKAYYRKRRARKTLKHA